MVKSVIQSGYVAWTVLALIVVVMIVLTMIRKAKDREFDREFMFALAIFLSFLGGGVITRGWWLAWRFQFDEGIDVSWMVEHPMVIIGIVTVCAGALLHIRSFSLTRYGELGWLLSALVTGALVIAYNQII